MASQVGWTRLDGQFGTDLLPDLFRSLGVLWEVWDGEQGLLKSVFLVEVEVWNQGRCRCETFAVGLDTVVTWKGERISSDWWGQSTHWKRWHMTLSDASTKPVERSPQVPRGITESDLFFSRASLWIHVRITFLRGEFFIKISVFSFAEYWCGTQWTWWYWTLQVGKSWIGDTAKSKKNSLSLLSLRYLWAFYLFSWHEEWNKDCRCRCRCRGHIYVHTRRYI